MGVDGDVADADLVVEVGAGGAAAVADVAQDLAADDGLAGDHGEAGHMTIDGLDAVAVVDDDLTAVAVLHLGGDDSSVSGGADGNTVGGGDVDAGVELAFTVAGDWILALAEAAGDRSEDGPKGGRVGVQRTGAEAAEGSGGAGEGGEAADGGAGESGVAQGVEGVDGLEIAVVVERD